PESRPTDEILSQYHRYHVQITLVDRSAKELRVIRRMTMSHELSVLFNEIVAYQLGNHIGREEYDAQVSIYQNKFPDLQTVVDAADRFEQLEAAPDDPEMAARVRNR
ncbi:MAG TPA: hypothetical protein VM406_10350, partial [Noviherbaspirillum sp.]|nr:hypothetical protein [Noviherbaspirillum sp.]